MKKIIGIFVCMLLITAIVTPVIGIEIIDDSPNKKPTSFENVRQNEGISDDDWPQFKHDSQGTAYINTAGPQKPTIKWKYLFGIEEVWGSPIIAYGNVYMGSNNLMFYCFDANTGEIQWYNDLPGRIGTSSAAVYENKVYMGGDYNYIYCWDAFNGSIIWQHKSKWGMAWAPTVYEGKVYIIKQIGGYSYGFSYLYCLDAENGIKLWEFDIGKGPSYTCPVAINEKVYFTSEVEGYIYCLNASNGIELWSKDIGTPHSSPAYYNGKIYVGGYHLYCLNATDGSTIWKDSLITSSHSPAVTEGKVFYKVNGTTCFDAETGEIIWNSPMRGGSSPAVCQGKIYFTISDSGDVACLDSSDGSLLGLYGVAYPGYPLGPVVVAYNKIYVSAGTAPFGLQGTIFCLDDPSKPPSNPIIKGPVECILDFEHEFRIWSTDPEGDKIRYYVDWGDGTNTGWIGPYLSEQQITIKHSWSEIGYHKIRVRAEDTYGIKGHWSEHNISVITAPALDIKLIKGGALKVSTNVRNLGSNDASDVNWSITLDGGFILYGRESFGTIDYIPVDGEATINSGVILGFGPTGVYVNATVPVGLSDTREQNGFIFLCFIKVNPGG